MIAQRCIGGGCLNYVYDPRFDYCDSCFDRLRDLVNEAAKEWIAAAEAYLREDA